MTKILALAATVAMLAAASTAADARGRGNSGASAFSPGHQFKQSGPVPGYRGASGYAPGQLKRSNGPSPGYHGASGYAPGRRFKGR